MAQDTTLIQHFHKRFGLWHLCKVKRLLFMTICADCGYSISRYIRCPSQFMCNIFYPKLRIRAAYIEACMPGTGYH